MARKRMVTRTIKSTQATVLCVNVVLGEPVITECHIAGTFANNFNLLKATKQILDTEEVKVVAIKSSQEIEQQYGMEETEFIKLAQVLTDSETPTETETETETESN